MRYLGGKFRVRKQLGTFFNSKLKEGQPFVDLFCGGCWITSEIDQNRTIIANDKHKYLISMWQKLQEGWIPPEDISEEKYSEIKKNKELQPELAGFVGFNCSFGAKWFGGYARDKKNKTNFAKTGKQTILKQIEKMRFVTFTNKDYSEVDIPAGALVYCDIPYRDTTQYSKKEVGTFDHDTFYKWVEDNKYKYDIYISEYGINKPPNFDIVWYKKSSKGLRTKTGDQTTTEILMVPKR